MNVEIGDEVSNLHGNGIVVELINRKTVRVRTVDGDMVPVPRGLCQIIKKGVGGSVAPAPAPKKNKKTKAPVGKSSDWSGGRRVVFTPASTITQRATLWVWDNWLPMGALSLMAGREGIGKSTVMYDRASSLTRGELPGDYFGTPRSVTICATEDSWSRTIVPRLIAHNADLDRIFHVSVEVVEGFGGALVLPTDLDGLEDLVVEHDVGLVILDPLLSRLDEKLDTNKDSQVRQALEPLSALADRTGTNVTGLMHVNKGQGRDALTSIMASRAFPAVARSVLMVLADPEDSETKVLALPKNNLGKTDPPSYTYQIEGVSTGYDKEAGKDITTGHIVWTGTTDQTADDLVRAGEDKAGGSVSAVGSASEWLIQYLTSVGGSAPSADVKAAGAAAGHNAKTLQRATKRAGVASVNDGFPRTSVWKLVLPDSRGVVPTASVPTAVGTNRQD